MFEIIILLLPLQVNVFNRDRTPIAYSSPLAISECWEKVLKYFKCGQYICKVCANGLLWGQCKCWAFIFFFSCVRF